MGDVHPQGNPHYWLDPANGRRIAQTIKDKLGQLSSADRAYFDQRYAEFDKRLAAAEKPLGRSDGALQGNEDRDVSPLLAELHGALRVERDRLCRAEAGHSAHDRRTRSTSSRR